MAGTCILFHFAERYNMRIPAAAALALFALSSMVFSQAPKRPVDKNYRQKEYNRLLQVNRQLEVTAKRIRKLGGQIRDREKSLDYDNGRFDSYLKRVKVTIRQIKRTKWGIRPYKCPNGKSFSQCNHTRTKSSYLSKRDLLKREATDYLDRANRLQKSMKSDKKKLGAYKSSFESIKRTYASNYAKYLADVRRYNESLKKK